MSPRHLVILIAVLLLSNLYSLAQQTIITPSQIKQMQEDRKKLAHRYGYHQENVPHENNASLNALPTPAAIHDDPGLKNNLTIMQKVLDGYSKNYYGGCQINLKGEHTSNTDAAVAHLYLNNQFQALLLASRALAVTAPTSPDYVRKISNLGAILTEMGQPKAAIPFLQYAVDSLSPQNPSLLNNLGQAYARTKEYTLAVVYLNQAVKVMPKHPNANLTLALISEGEIANNGSGAAGSAASYAEKALKGGFFSRAWNMVTQHDPKARLEEIIKDRLGTFTYIKDINPYIAAQYANVDEGVAMEDLHKRTEQGIDVLWRYYHEMNRELAPPVKKGGLPVNVKRQADDYVSKVRSTLAGGLSNPAALRALAAESQSLIDVTSIGFYHFPFAQFAFSMDLSLSKSHDQDTGKKEISLQEINDQRDKAMKKVEEFQKENVSRWKDMRREDQCREIDDFENGILSEYAKVHDSWRDARFNWLKDYYNKRLFWTYMKTNNDTSYREDFYMLMDEFWDQMKTLEDKKIYLKKCLDLDPAKPDKTPVTIVGLKADVVSCPFDDLTITAPAGTSSIVINCQRKIKVTADFASLQGCSPPPKQDIYAGTYTIGLDAALKNYLVIENGMMTDISIRWSESMKFDGSTSEWWLNTGLVSLPH